MAPTHVQSELSCSHCEQPINVGERHYRICWELRRLSGRTIEIEDSQVIAHVCAKCSLEFDLTRLDIPSVDGWYSFEPLGDAITENNQCWLCRSEFLEQEEFEAALIRPASLTAEPEEPTVVVALCRSCIAKRALRNAEPPNNAVPPCCYQCGKYTGYNGGMADERKFYVAHRIAKNLTPVRETVRVCQSCFFEGPLD